MLKKFVYMLIVAITLQLSWGVASAYCTHETGKTAQHFGHHDHEHQSTQESSKENSQKSKQSNSKFGVGDADCEYCHHTVSSPNIIATNQLAFIVPDASTRIEFLSQPYQSHIPERLAKPNWRSTI